MLRSVSIRPHFLWDTGWRKGRALEGSLGHRYPDPGTRGQGVHSLQAGRKKKYFHLNSVKRVSSYIINELLLWKYYEETIY